MAIFAIHNGQIVSNIIKAETKEIAELVTSMQAIEVTDLPIGVGWYFENNKWFPPKTFPSWVWNETSYNWDPPIPMPDDAKSITNPDGKIYGWNEETVSWIEINN